MKTILLIAAAGGAYLIYRGTRGKSAAPGVKTAPSVTAGKPIGIIPSLSPTRFSSTPSYDTTPLSNYTYSTGCAGC